LISLLYLQDGRTLVHIAAQNGHTSVLHMLFNKDFDAASRDKVASSLTASFKTLNVQL